MDLEVITFQLFAILGGFCLGFVWGSRDPNVLSPPDSAAQRNKVSYL